jgi:hypothetical protein
MSTSPKIQATHLSRQAVVYVRQSTPKQVEQNQESRHGSESAESTLTYSGA